MSEQETKYVVRTSPKSKKNNVDSLRLSRLDWGA